ncbi:glycoside hydrolase family 3 protein [Roseimarinus sediminis]|uniref:glycoside hydrolase family 3 protein n=1 Tax=Roseimarinus sediminis TaxID=1610899 RepID=UPI003D1BC45D
MKNDLKWLFILAMLVPVVQTIKAQEVTEKYRDTSLSFETRAYDLVERMTLEEKISQIGNASEAIPRLDVNEYEWWNECLHGVARAGVATVFPQAIGMAATFDTQMMAGVAEVISDEARAKHHEALRNNDFGRYKGLTFWSPNINIFRDPRWGRGHETYGEDPYLSGRMGVEFVKGLQGDDPKYLKLVATAKHFAVHNGPEPDRHSFNAVPNARDLWETYLPAFYDLVVEAKAYSVMGAYNRVDGESASASWLLLEDILRKQWGFEGYVVSDCGAIRDIYAYHKIVNTPQEAAAIGVRRGCDLNCGRVYQQWLLEAVNEGLIDEGEIDLAVYRLMLARMKLGMFDPEEMVPFAQIAYEVNNSKAHDELALAMAQKSMTLLKNNGILPLEREQLKKVAVFGPNANSIVALRANYHGDASNPVTVLEGIRKALPGNVELVYEEVCPLVAYDGGMEKYETVPASNLSAQNAEGEQEQGLTGAYYRGTAMQGEPVLVRTDQQIRMMWQEDSPTATEVAQGILTPEEALGKDNFSIRWTGELLAPGNGEYEIGLISDDGCRLFLDGKTIVDEWTEHAMAPSMGKFTFEKGKKYPITIEYFESGQDAGAMLVWKKIEDEKEKKSEEFIVDQKVLDEAKAADVIIFVGGLDAEWEGEEMRDRVGIDGFNGGDRTKIELPAVQLKTLRALEQTGRPVVMVLMAGSAIAFDGAEQELDALLMSWYPGQRGGDAVAEVLFGDYNPAGRLPVTFYQSTNELADFRDYNMQAGKGFTYRYYQGKALYPFGHGLSYTTFEYTGMKVDKKMVCDSDELIVTVKVKNTGEYDGEEVVQLYVADRESDKGMPRKQLRRFERVALASGASREISFTLKVADDLRYYDAFYRRYLVEPGEFEIQIGASSEDIRLKEVIRVE